MKIILFELSNKEISNKRNVLDIYNNRFMFEKVPYLNKEMADYCNEYPIWMIDLYDAFSQRGIKTENVIGSIFDLRTILDSDDIIVIVNITEATSEYYSLLEDTKLIKVYSWVLNKPRNTINSIEAIKIEYGLPTTFKGLIPNDNIFKNSLPRITTVSGCPYNCTFCTIEHNLKRVPLNIVNKLFKAYKDFETIYIGNPTFGLLADYELDLLEKNKKKNRKYIVQTRPDIAVNADLYEWKKAGIKYIELGIESFTPTVLSNINKGFESYVSKQAIERLNGHGFKVIPNIIIGFPEDLLRDNISIIKYYFTSIYYLNIYYYTDYKSHLKEERDETIMLKRGNQYKDVIDLYKINYQFLKRIL